MNPDEGNLRSSHREMSQLKLKKANMRLHELANQFMETHVKDMCIRQRLQPDKEAIVKRGTFYVLENDGRAEPGFLLFMPKQPAVFIFPGRKDRKDITITLRMRTDVSLGNGGGTLLIASLDKIQHTLRLEDIYIWKGEDVFSQKSFSERRKHMKEFVERGWVPDARLLGGIQTSIANPKPLSELANIQEKAFSVDLIPELPGKRRFWFPLALQAQAQAQTPAPVAAPTPIPAALKEEKKTPLLEKRIRALAIPLESLPDVYDLSLENGTPLCRAAVQQLSLSQQLRAQKVKQIPVWAEWKAEFGRYEIISLS